MREKLLYELKKVLEEGYFSVEWYDGKKIFTATGIAHIINEERKDMPDPDLLEWQIIVDDFCMTEGEEYFDLYESGIDEYLSENLSTL